MSGSEIPSDVENDAKAALLSLIPEESRSFYEATYRKFVIWWEGKNLSKICEKVMLAYISQICFSYKA